MAYTQRQPSYTCIVGPTSSQTQGELLGPEAGPAEAAWQWWPMGTACSWETNLGIERFAPDWTLTSFAGVTALGGIIAIATARRATRRPAGGVA